MRKMLITVLAPVMLVGCASITSESTQLVRVDALDEQGHAVADAECDLTNDKGTYKVDAGKHAMIGKSGKNLAIRCEAPGRDDVAEGTAISRAGAGMFGNIIFGGGIGAIIDHNTGSAYNYPDWIQVIFGKILSFDRTRHQDGVPMKGEEVVAETQSIGSTQTVGLASE